MVLRNTHNYNAPEKKPLSILIVISAKRSKDLRMLQRKLSLALSAPLVLVHPFPLSNISTIYQFYLVRIHPHIKNKAHDKLDFQARNVCTSSFDCKQHYSLLKYIFNGFQGSNLPYLYYHTIQNEQTLTFPY